MVNQNPRGLSFLEPKVPKEPKESLKQQEEPLLLVKLNELELSVQSFRETLISSPELGLPSLSMLRARILALLTSLDYPRSVIRTTLTACLIPATI